MQKILYTLKNLNINGRIDFYRNVTACVNVENEQLIIHCCDINNTAKVMFNDSGVEFYIIIDKKNTDKLMSKLHNKNLLFNLFNRTEYTNETLLDILYAKFGEKDSCFEDIMDYCKEHSISYEYQ